MCIRKQKVRAAHIWDGSLMILGLVKLTSMLTITSSCLSPESGPGDPLREKGFVFAQSSSSGWARKWVNVMAGHVTIIGAKEIGTEKSLR